MPSPTKDELRIYTPTGMLGYGYSHQLFYSALEDGIDAIICDSGSTDSGPSKLALGSMSCPRDAYIHDLEPIIDAANSHRTPVLIGSAGGDGSNAHVDVFVDIIENIIQRHGYRSMKIIKIYSEIDKDLVKSQLGAGTITPCGTAVPALQTKDIEDASLIVAQMGLEPYLKAMEEHPDFDIIIGGRTYDPSPYAAFCLYHGFNDLGLAYHMGKILECGAICAVPKSREALAVVRRDHFDVVPSNPNARCTPVSVAAHTLYEKTRPDILVGPGGTLSLQDTTYEGLQDNRTVRVRGAKFIPVPDGQYTVKLEAARTAGYHSTFFGGFADPILISQIDDVVARIRSHVASVCKFDYDLKLITYGSGDNISMFAEARRADGSPQSVAITGEARADTQDKATHVINAARIACMHIPYQGQVATSGNFAMSCAPFDIPMGKVCEFCIYHLMPVADPVELFPRQLVKVQGSTQTGIRPRAPLAVSTDKDHSKANSTSTSTPAKVVLTPRPPPGYHYLGELASVIRSKNAGPYELTFDVMFGSPENYSKVKSSNVLTKSTIADLYRIDEAEVVAALWWDPAMAFKATVKRPIISGGFGETDTHGSCQHTRLMYLQIQVSAK
ncbi:hypothetical protein A1O3_00245 [Capronia epimyces CBS 606.96]|uniref:3-methylaspartate ammonia-lyase n=1 Tax=Capronia epimyces CBS 606.96 TaxID=1182542 RepID=W9YPU7_9EURO|nr:uncharacterized protein A1O3_00245 [Capronia epimyces CBS 606.96]EXJ91695.1 hypothetical protein A1O3_00245 [Capronia epimyces CBS 606.96]